ncbi:MAG TPA: hypothetical protein VKY74_02500 [Chloroflexia bacterium]|nr:hypothetical protein [Chloroflexia bacterium]
MSDVLALCVAGHRCRVHCADPAFRVQIAARYAPFRDPAPAAAPDLTLEVTVRPALIAVGWEPHFITHPGAAPLPAPADYEPARDGPLAGYAVWPVAGGLRLAAEQTLRAELDLAGRHGWIVLAPALSLFHTALRQFLAYLLPLTTGCLLHASGVLLDGRAAGFFGVSGSGKSTIARLAPGPVLTDETLGLTQAGPRWTAHSTPFNGDYDPPPAPVAAAPLAGLFHLARGTRDQAVRLPWHAAVQALSGSLLYQVDDPAYQAALLAQVCRLAQDVPCYRLEFRPTPAVWASVAAALAPP